MKYWCGFIIYFLFVECSFGQEVQQVGKSVHAFNFKVEELMSVAVDIEYTPKGEPVFYSAYLETDVCSDGLCEPISITINWDLLGRFLDYHTDEKHTLTKFDHIELTKEDHDQLHKILSDTGSIIRDYEVEDMIDPAIQLHSSIQVDAVTGATNPTFDGSTVEGALYTVYTLWHFTNGPIRKELLEHTETFLLDTLKSDSFISFMLGSNNRDYVSFIFEKMTDSQKKRFVTEIVTLVSNDDAYIPHFALANLNHCLLANHSLQNQLLSYFSKVDPSVRNALLAQFKSLHVDKKGLEMLISTLPTVREDQSAKVFSIIENNKAQLNKKLLEQIKVLSAGDNKQLSQQAQYLLLRVNTTL